ncbi:MAG: hypothetical protein EB023_12975 [Flavobacteriia bacterium]|nr:hypothetical protein [Flavobacteriia bacterium]
MDRNTITGLILIGIVLTVFTVINQPSQEDIDKAKKAQVTSQKKSNKAQVKSDTLSKKDAKRADYDKTNRSTVAQAPTRDSITKQLPVKNIFLENENLKLCISTKGANLSSVFLKNFKSYDAFSNKSKQPLCLFNNNDGENYLSLPGFPTTKELVFEAVQNNNHVTLTSQLDSLHQILISYSLNKANQVDYAIQLKGFAKDVAENAQFNWNLNFRKTERKLSEQRKISTVCFAAGVLPFYMLKNPSRLKTENLM